MNKISESSNGRSLVITALISAISLTVYSTPKIRDNGFFVEYSALVGSRLDDLPSKTRHCGVCHFNFEGGGPRNPYGLAVQANYSGKDKNYQEAVQLAADIDSDGDGVFSVVEITDDTTVYDNTPTFPGLSAGNVGQVSNVDPADLAGYLTPTSGGPDTDPPVVTVTSPDGGETVVGNTNLTALTWTVTDDSSIVGVHIYLSLDNGATYSLLAYNHPDTGSFDWYAANRPSSNCLVKVEAIDSASNVGDDESDSVFVIVPPTGGLTTLRDFDQPGSQPLVDSGLPQELPSNCASCHGGYSEEHEPYSNWLGSMMAQAGIDPIFKANMVIANQDAPDSGDLCLRCHNSRGWLDGRSVPTDGSQMTADDQAGVSCDLCHRLVDPANLPGAPAVDTNILASLEAAPEFPGNGMYVFDPSDHRRGPFNDSVSPHTDLVSPFHQDAAICGTCHDVSNPVFERDGTNVEYVANTFDEASPTNSPYILMPVERTYSEWFHSAYNSSNGIYAPQFAGNKSGYMVSSCQDCHMPDILGQGCDPAQFTNVAERTNLPLHDMTGGSSWLSRVLPQYAGLDAETGSALTNGADRSEYMLRKAARMSAVQDGTNLNVTVINDTGHKLPTGYPEGRRVWINVRFYDESETLLAEHGAYNDTNALLTTADTTVYEIHPGIGPDLAPVVGLPAGPSFHFVLNNQVYEDNRIPPRGFTNSEFDSFGGAPVGHHYDDGQHWDNSLYEIPDGAVSAHARLFYQSTSKEFMEFLRDENTTDNTGTNVYNMWVANDRCPPVLMTEAWWPENFTIQSIGLVDGNQMGINFNTVSGYTYWVEFADTLSSNTVWAPFASNNWIEAAGSSLIVTDDFTEATSGEEPASGHRFYRIVR